MFPVTGLTAIAAGAIFAVTPVTVSSPVVHVPRHGYAYETVTVRFPACVRDVTAYAEPASGDYQEVSTEHRGAVPAWHRIRVRFAFTRGDERDRWFVVSALGDRCGDGALVQVPGDGASFRVVLP